MGQTEWHVNELERKTNWCYDNDDDDDGGDGDGDDNVHSQWGEQNDMLSSWKEKLMLW